MTANTTRTRELDIQTIVYLAGRAAGLVNSQQRPGTQAYAEFAADARDFLEVEVDALLAEGVMARQVDTVSVVMASGQAKYALPADTVEVFGYATVGSTSVETVLVPILREAYHILSPKDAQGTPTTYYVEKHETISVYLWPTPGPENAGSSVYFQRHRLFGDNNDGGATPDLERYWASYLVYAVAHHLMIAAGRPAADCAYVRSRADEQLKKCIGKSRQRPGTYIRLDHPTGWGR